MENVRELQEQKFTF